MTRIECVTLSLNNNFSYFYLQRKTCLISIIDTLS